MKRGSTLAYVSDKHAVKHSCLCYGLHVIHWQVERGEMIPPFS